DETSGAAFLESFEPLRRKVAHFGVFNALSQTLLKLTSPGLPDIYQGNEIWDFSLVDPDNRRPVDYELRQRLLASLERAGKRRGATRLCAELLAASRDGRVKLHLTQRALGFRREHAAIF